ncbi:MAG: TusE/DsrC/DsvC family sulfur relay protein [Gammaproteobacteria bacterium]|nr:TusE/DsrC/DsvC family sulfur relay protein [Gammaproteobacteria bacterium]
MTLNIAGRTIETNYQGFLFNMADWSEDYASEIAERDNLKLYNDHWELIYYFRESHIANMAAPTMHQMVRDLGRKNVRFHEQKAYEQHIYSLFNNDPVHELCKLAGLPMPQPDD